ncbi:hypothetical protein H5U35_07090, partial [Candidatus Aerophobetes bacterium]|nr:hypothetical protein [Candidatus Aerophobetes bacterium]
MVRIKSILRRKNLLIFIFSVFLFITLHIAQAEKVSLILLEGEKDIALVTHSKTFNLKEGQNFLTFNLFDEKIIKDSLYAQIRGAKLLEQRIALPSTLSLVVECVSREEVEVNLSYLTEGLNWEVNYQAELSPEEESLSISCFLRVENNQKKNLQDIELGFMKEAHLLQDQTELLLQEEKKNIEALSEVKCDVRINLEKEAEYFIYKLRRPITLLQGEDIAFLLFSFADIPCKKIYLYDGEKYGDMVIKKIVFKTPSGENSDIVFPSGNLYIYKKGENGSKI